jgi:dipeptidyl aminopeptidase/acylaminoacyl peptidase
MPMPVKMTLPFGTWPSPVTPALVARGSRRIGSIQADGDILYWTESRPEEGGRQVIMRAKPGATPCAVLPKPLSARSRVHEYGGGEFLAAGEVVYFVNDKDQQVYVLDAEGPAPPRRITGARGTRFADFALDARRNRLIAVAEMHAPKRKAAPHALPRNTLVAIGLGAARARIIDLAAGRDFYASPSLSDDGAQLAFLAWDLPDMPWDSATLYVAGVRADGTLARPRKIAGGDGSAVFQPEWGADGALTFVWDKTGWGALYRWQQGTIAEVCRVPQADLSRPQWVFGARSYARHPQGRIGMVFLAQGTPRVRVQEAASGKVAAYARLGDVAARIDDPCPFGGAFAALVSQPVAAPAVKRLAPQGLGDVAPPEPLPVPRNFISRAEPHAFRTARGQTAYGFYYPPLNPQVRGPRGALPPAIVFVHGGPTSMTDAGLKLRMQFYTSRGFAAFDVNYAGSTGYGRAYRNRLDGQWGIADVADCAAAARHLAGAGLADKSRIAITGGSAGGYTTLMALATTDAFAAGSSHYGVSDLALLMEHTHKFESGYLHRLLGTSPRNWRKTCAARSPINLIDGIAAPVILFQGLDDKVVPPEQSRLIAQNLKRRGIDVALHEFAGEAHGFRRAETIIAVLEAELAFFQRALRLGEDALT